MESDERANQPKRWQAAFEIWNKTVFYWVFEFVAHTILMVSYRYEGILHHNKKGVESFTQNKLPLFPTANHPKVFQYHPQYGVVQLPSRIYCQYHPLTHLSNPCYQATRGSGLILQPHLPSHMYSHITIWNIATGETSQAIYSRLF